MKVVPIVVCSCFALADVTHLSVACLVSVATERAVYVASVDCPSINPPVCNVDRLGYFSSNYLYTVVSLGSSVSTSQFQHL